MADEPYFEGRDYYSYSEGVAAEKRLEMRNIVRDEQDRDIGAIVPFIEDYERRHGRASECRKRG